ncbi:hypothetical protein GCM10011521_09650 [Arenimonas soli]|uniref:DUF91 domain-containing protein n=1 Tax=Arenimonas soli TaxID=2269504 RepID=A0ABQ1HFJ5_9GAMM|nr:hypothetical protein GCM10011521_09650 [Arenimonas soli]
MGLEHQVAEQLSKELQLELGGKFEVGADMTVDDFQQLGSLGSRIDLVVRSVSGDGEPLFLIELKTGKSPYEVPYSVLNSFKLWKTARSARDAVLVLATTRKIGSLLRGELSSQGVQVVESSSIERLVSELTKLIRSRGPGARSDA